MNRIELLQAGLQKDWLGLEIGPLHNPICAKRDGWKILTMDVLPTSMIKSQYQDDPGVDVDLIEEVDIIFSGSLFKSLESYGHYCNEDFLDGSNCLDYIVSSHNFEHQPNPIQFLVDCQNALRNNGILSMAIPIGSRCFDCWRPLTTCGEWIDAFYAQREAPSYGNIADSFVNYATLPGKGDITGESYSLEQIELNQVLASNYLEDLCELARNKVYVDAHCSVLNPYSFVVLFEDLLSLELVKTLRIKDVKLNGAEFIVSIENSGAEINSASPEEMAKRRTSLARKAMEFQYRDLIKQ